MDYKHQALQKAEKYGIYEYSVKGSRMVYYSYFGIEGFYKVVYDLKNGKTIERKHLRYKHTPKFLIAENGGTKYNYFCG